MKTLTEEIKSGKACDYISVLKVADFINWLRGSIKENEVCSHCGTIAYGDGDCHCKENDFIFVDKTQLIKEINQRIGGKFI